MPGCCQAYYMGGLTVSFAGYSLEHGGILRMPQLPAASGWHVLAACDAWGSAGELSDRFVLPA